MKRFLIASSVLAFVALAACDKVDNPFPTEGAGTSLLDWSLYPDGDSAHYFQNHWPTFSPNTNTQRNVLIEDFTGHWCTNCPPTADAIHTKVLTDPEHIFAAAIHSGPSGLNDFQQLHPPTFVEVFYNDEGLEIGTTFGSIAGSAFIGNPRIAISRVSQSGQVTCTAGSLNTLCSNILSSALKVNIQSASNYFPSTRGLFLHTEVERLDAGLSGDLGLVVYLIEDSLVAPQKMPDGTTNATYIHRDIMRGCIDGKAFGRTIASADFTDEKYYANYSYRLPDQYDPANMRLFIYVFDKATYEIYQVIEQHI